MLWATFEHFGNTPNASYDYVAVDDHGNKTVKRAAQDKTGAWLFSASDAVDFNLMHMHTSDDNGKILADKPFAISPSDTLRMHPWGAGDPKPNGQVDSTAASNSEIIAINISVLRQLPAGDVRRNYFMLGNTWTKKGKAPTGRYPGYGVEVEGQEIGTSQLANSTMETYDQGTPAAGLNCFSCHAPKFEGDPLTSVSHIYRDLKPLPLPPV